MSSSARRRLLRDFRRLQSDPPQGITGSPTDENILLWQALIFGPEETPWEGGTFKLSMEFTEEYPNKAPTVRFLTKMFHPNIYNNGLICLDILQVGFSSLPLSLPLSLSVSLCVSFSVFVHLDRP
mmetsp:Transcript_16786/g.63877  ORF Transcript_16786/g.63877 Transcript_16786/m.63877 type:complete len:125 (-) Transcript_16786:922-1296(-)